MKLHERIELRKEQDERRERRNRQIYEYFVVDKGWAGCAIMALRIFPWALSFALMVLYAK